ncbi:hypothetical protein DW228_06035 [Bacteroides fragilis]|uniref:DUF4906 domain-containing protein n=1 Tax=Bacteroides fragilis TaxID=817 RepID=A0A396C9P4_BACFG|nr:hypothetical protein [Bacteroides fragilis]RHH14356.1 hypothetical protein DW228_06035 [Bacteroides fragilis]
MKKIKQYIYYGSISLLLLFPVLAACSDNDQMTEGNPEVITGHATFLSVKAAVNTVVSEDEEDKVHTIRVIAYRSGTYTSPLCNEFFKVKSGMSTDAFEMKSGKADFYIIVNETAEMNLDGHVTVPEIKETVFQITHLSDPVSTNGLPMYREYVGGEAVIIGQHPRENPLEFTADVDRIMAKLTLRISNSTHKDILLTNVAVKSLPSNSWLAPVTYRDEPKEEISKDLALKVADDRSSYEDVSLYIPEYMVADATKRSYLYITGKSDKGFDCKYTISLGHGLRSYRTDGAVKDDIGTTLTAESFNIIRNTHYEISIDDIQGYENNKLTFLIGITPWNNIPENYYEGGTWVKQPVSSRIPINGSTSFTAEFTHTEAPTIVYKWYRSQYKQTKDDPLPTKPTIEWLMTEELPKGKASTLNFESSTDTIKPYISGEIFCMAAPISASNFRESSHVTLMVIGDWDGEGRDFYPKMQDWKPTGSSNPGTSYLLLDDRDDTYGGKKIYRVKLMADGNWWMIQDLAYSQNEPTSMDEFYNKAMFGTLQGMGGIGSSYWGACTLSGETTGGYLYTKEAAVGDRVGLTTVALDSHKEENVIGLCPKGWHLPGNKDEEFNKEWRALNDSFDEEMSTKTISLFDYYNPKCFNAYTTNYVAISPDNASKTIHKDEDTYRFHGGFVSLGGGTMFGIGVKIGFDSEILKYQTEELFINDDPLGDKNAFPNHYSTAVLRCVRNN